MRSFTAGAFFSLIVFVGGCGEPLREPGDFEARSPDSFQAVERCADHDPLRRALFGDLHVHTALSSDAWNYDVRVRPADAYRYAFGEAIRLPPLSEDGVGTREVRIDRPLDFAAVTDHAEFLGEVLLCDDPNADVYESETCTGMRASTTPLDSPLLFVTMNPWPGRSEDVCGEDSERCIAALRSAWEETIAAAEAWNDASSDCARTTFIGYEYSSLRLGSNLHRNVIFKNAVVPLRPASYIDFPREWDLWKSLRDGCIDSGTGCDALAIPHNSNISNGRMFSTDYPETSNVEEQAERAALRARLEPIVEIMQHKGDSECRAEMPGVLAEPDEHCRFEKFGSVRFKENQGVAGECFDFMADWLPHLGPGGCTNHRDFVRYVLTEGLAEEERLGVNPFKLGLSASTDTHNGMAGGVVERGWPGHVGTVDGDVNTRLGEQSGMGNVENNPGGLIGVWAAENSREAIFDSMRRREVFGTSGPRIKPRFFGGWDFPPDLCDEPDLVAQADRKGVPMGSDLPSIAESGSPTFAVFALADPGTPQAPGNDLDRLEIIKGWVDDEGRLHQKVFLVAGGEGDASVDPDTCEPRGVGARKLCAIWEDPEFDTGRRAVYYARVLENPSCRYSAWKCLELPLEDRPEGCEHGIMERFIKERAWTSPIWYTPRMAGAGEGVPGVKPNTGG